jgi:subtilisin family serine protease
MRLPAFACALGALLALAVAVPVGSGAPARTGTILLEPSGPPLTAKQRWPLDLIRLPAAWDVTTGGSPGPLIAVVDTGVEVTSDLTGRVESVSVVGGEPGTDLFGHGTEVAGIVAASGADGTGLAGVCWSCRILSLQVSLDGDVSADDIAKAIDVAIARGASVINLSLGADLHTNAERDAIKRAVAAGIVVVASAGNDGSLLPKFPAAYAGVLAVGAAGPDGKVAAFSNRGSWVGVLAPACGAAIDINGAIDDEFCGTSAAAPFVSGLAGLLKSVAPNARGQDIIAAIQSSARAREGSAHGLVSAPAAIAAIKRIKPGSTSNTKGALLHVVKRPLISGVGAVGARLTTSTGVFSGNLTGIQIRWQRCPRIGVACKTVSSGSAYLVVRADRGKRLRVLSRATGEDGIPVNAFSRFLPVRG